MEKTLRECEIMVDGQPGEARRTLDSLIVSAAGFGEGKEAYLQEVPM